GDSLDAHGVPDADEGRLVAWVKAGPPGGNARGPPPQPSYASEWLIGQPDAIFSMQEDYPVPADGTVAYQYFSIPTNTTEDRWIQAMEVRAGDPKVVHHVIVYAAPPAPPAGSTPPAGAAGQPPAQRPAPLFTFAEATTNIPAG